jgi:hypothetical protein
MLVLFATAFVLFKFTISGSFSVMSKNKGHIALSSISDGTTKDRKTIVHGKVIRDEKGGKPVKKNGK